MANRLSACREGVGGRWCGFVPLPGGQTERFRISERVAGPLPEILCFLTPKRRYHYQLFSEGNVMRLHVRLRLAQPGVANPLSACG